MTAHYQSTALAMRQEIVAPPAQRSCEDHSFEIPSGLYWTSAAFLFGFVAVTSIGFASAGLMVPIAVIVFFLAMFFTVPALFVRTSPKDSRRGLSWSGLMEGGMDTATGQTSGREAAVLVLILPLLIFCWGLAVVSIAALV